MTDPQVIEIQRRQLEPMSLTNSARYHAQCRSDIATVLALLIAQAAQLETLKSDRDRWQAKAFDLGNGMMDAMTERDVAQRTGSEDRHELQVFDKLATDLWAEGIAVKAQVAAQAAQLETVRQENEQLMTRLGRFIQATEDFRVDLEMSPIIRDADAPTKLGLHRYAVAAALNRLEATIRENAPDYAKASALTILPPPDGEP